MLFFLTNCSFTLFFWLDWDVFHFIRFDFFWYLAFVFSVFNIFWKKLAGSLLKIIFVILVRSLILLWLKTVEILKIPFPPLFWTHVAVGWMSNRTCSPTTPGLFFFWASGVSVSDNLDPVALSHLALDTSTSATIRWFKHWLIVLKIQRDQKWNFLNISKLTWQRLIKHSG